MAMEITFDWQQIYGALVSQSSRPPKSAFAAARQIENDIFEEGWPAGEVFGDQAHLIHRYGFSRATLREAVRLLEDRHVAHMRRGPGGGLIILPVSPAAIAPAVADYFHATGFTAEQIREVRTALRITDAYRAAFAEGPEALRLFTNEFRSRISEGAGAGLLDGRRWPRCGARPAGSHVFTDLFTACLNAIEDRTCAQTGRTPSPPEELQQGLAHSLARKLMREFHGVPAVGTQRVGTEDQLCERHRVGREVLRQAIRVLESRGLIDSQRGRTHGLHTGASDAAPLVELVVAYLSCIHLRWSELEAVARILSRIVRLIVAAQSTPQQRQELLRRLERIDDNWDNSPSLITAQLLSEWAIPANPFLIFMEQCASAFCARSSAAIWRCFDDSELPTQMQLQQYIVTTARGDLVQADRFVDGVCDRVHALRNRSFSRGAFNGGAKARALA
jgi:DNA-binding FadR family transcriptional regulator